MLCNHLLINIINKNNVTHIKECKKEWMNGLTLLLHTMENTIKENMSYDIRV